MEWVAGTLHATSEHGLSSINTADAHTSAASSRLTDSGVSWWLDWSAACQKMVTGVRKCSRDVRDEDQTSQLSTSVSIVNTT